MKSSLFLWLAAAGAAAQTGTGRVQGTVTDGKTGKAVPAAIVAASRAGAPPFSKYTRTGGDGGFRIDGLTPGSYRLCVQTPGGEYLDPCDWGNKPVTVALAAGRNATGVALGVTAASVVEIRVRDAQRVLSQTTRDGRRPELSLGVWGPDGLYYPARAAGGPGVVHWQDGVPAQVFQIPVPRDTDLTLAIASRDVKLGDASGAALTGNERRESFRRATGETNPRNFAFTALGLTP